ncbi:MAG: HD domain-containing protein [Butyribacter sp.]|nr:HD domain-containing protein [bacterium]MDY3853865.1 HD domain-containing protein [Butyribacter sp.]
MSRIEQQMEFMREIDGLKQIGRQTYLKDGSRKENDAEHSWHLAMMALVMQEYANEQIDLLRVVSMVLIHDVVELDAGDTYAYDDAGNTTKREREVAAADRIFHILPDDQAVYFRDLWEEFEAENTAEAKFAHVLDNIQPMMLNDASDGKAWREHQVKLSQILKRNEHTQNGSEEIWKYAKEELIAPNMKKGNIIRD